MAIAHKVDATCPTCGNSEAWMWTKGGESKERLECDECKAEWSRRAQ